MDNNLYNFNSHVGEYHHRTSRIIWDDVVSMNISDEWMAHTAKHVFECKKQPLEEWAKCGFCYIYLTWYESMEPLMDEIIKEMGANPNKLGSDEEALKGLMNLSKKRSKYQ